MENPVPLLYRHAPYLWAAGGYALIAGLVGLIGWFSGFRRLIDWAGTGIAIQANACVACVLAGASLILLSFDRGFCRALALAAGVTTALIGGLTLSEHASGTDLGIDTLLVSRTWGAGTLAPGRMGIPASVSFTISGTALALLAARGIGRIRRPIGTFIAASGVLICAIASLSIVGFALGADRLYSLPRFTAIAPQTATVLTAIALGLLWTIPDLEPLRTLREDSAAGVLTRRALPFVLSVPLMIALLRIRGEELGLYEENFGTALRTLVEVGILVALLWWAAGAVRRHEIHIRRNADTFYNLIHNSPFGVYVVDADFRLIEVSAGAAKVFQHVRPLLGRDFAEVLRAIWAEPFASQAIARFRHTLETGEVYRAPDTTERRNDVNAVESYDWKLERITLPDGRFGVVCYFYDLTERLALEARLRQSEERFRLALAAAPVVVFEHDRDLRYIWVNNPLDEFATALGRTDEEILGESGRELMRVKRAVLESGQGVRREVTLPVRGEPGVRIYDLVAEPIVREGSVEGVACAAIDVTDRATSARALARANAELQRFVSIASHDLKEPLRGVAHLAAFVLEDEPGISEETRSRLERIQSLCDRLTTMINGLLDYARSGGRQHAEICHLDEIVRSALDKLGELLTGAEVVVHPGLPSVAGDPVLLERAIANLVANAVKHNRADRKSIEIGARDGAVYIRDNGVGIEAKHHRRIFDLFARIPGREPTDGVGLGLALVKNIIESHSGRIWVESSPGDGSTFWVQLPRWPSSAPPTPPRMVSTRPERAPIL
jgi:signal transduction histidine kinase